MPYSITIYGLLNKVSLYKIHVDTQACIGCGICRQICPMDADPVRNPDSAECIRCGRCVHTCPVSAIRSGFVIESCAGTAEAKES